MQTLFTFFIRLVLLATGLLFAASLLLVVAVFAAVWGLRYGFARLTGRPVSAFVVRIDPRASCGRVWRRTAQGPMAGPPDPMPAARREIGDVTDVQAKPPRP